jgi:MFS family permease
MGKKTRHEPLGAARTHGASVAGGLNPALARLIAAHIFLHACMAGTRMAAPLLALREGHSPAAVGVLMSLFALTQVFLALPAGRFAERHGLKRPLSLSVCAATAGAGLAVAFPVFPVLCLSALLTGGATGAASIALQRHVGRAAENPTQLKQVFSWLAIGPAVSNFLGPFSAGLVIDHGGFRLAFLLMAMLPVLSWFWVRTVQELPPVVRADGHARSKPWDLLGEPMFRRLMLVNWFLASCWDTGTAKPSRCA